MNYEMDPMAHRRDTATARARQAAHGELMRAEAALAEAKSQLDDQCGIGVTLRLINRIGEAEGRVDDARRNLGAIDPTRTEE